MSPSPLQTAKPPLLHRLGKYLRGLAIRVFIYLAVYFVTAFISIGPCFWIWYGAVYVDGPKWIARFYAPLFWVCEQSEPLGRLLNNYIDWWIL